MSRTSELVSLGSLQPNVLYRTPNNYPIVDFVLVEEGGHSAFESLDGRALHLFQLSRKLPGNHVLIDKAYVVDIPPPFTAAQVLTVSVDELLWAFCSAVSMPGH